MPINWLQESAFRWALGLALLLLGLQWAGFAPELRFDRHAIEQGEWWRLLSCHIIHSNGWHWLFNAVGLVLMAALYGDLLPKQQLLWLLFWLGLGVGIGIWLFCPQTQRFVGLSGVLHGLFIWGAVQDIKAKRYLGFFLLITLLVKLGLDFFGPPSPSASLIQGRIHIESHLIGAMVGFLLTFVKRGNVD